jgi:hypothetical protein
MYSPHAGGGARMGKPDGAVKLMHRLGYDR